jgi:hypothetical protein
MPMKLSTMPQFDQPDYQTAFQKARVTPSMEPFKKL